MYRIARAFLLLLLLGQHARAQTALDLKNLQTEATNCLQRKDAKAAQAAADKSLVVAEQLYGNTSEKFSQALDFAARIYVNLRQPALAENCIVRIVNIIKQMKGPHDPMVAQEQASLAEFYANQGDLVKAESAYRVAVDVVDGSDQYVRHDVMPGLLNGLAKVLRAENKFGEASNVDDQAQKLRDHRI